MRIIMLGAGGHARSVADALGSTPISAAAVPDDAPLSPTPFAEKTISESELIAAGPSDVALVNGVGGNLADGQCLELFQRFTAMGFQFRSVVHSTAYVSATATLGAGVQVLAMAIVGPGAVIGDSVLINSGAIVEHDCRIADGVHVAPGAVLCGGVTIGAEAMIGAGATVIPTCVVGAGALVAAGAVVISNVDPHSTVAGTPARPIHSNP